MSAWLSLGRSGEAEEASTAHELGRFEKWRALAHFRGAPDAAWERSISWGSPLYEVNMIAWLLENSAFGNEAAPRNYIEVSLPHIKT